MIARLEMNAGQVIGLASVGPLERALPFSAGERGERNPEGRGDLLVRDDVHLAPKRKDEWRDDEVASLGSRKRREVGQSRDQVVDGEIDPDFFARLANR